MTGEAFGLRADLKAELAQLGQTLKPDAVMRELPPPPTSGRGDVVLLERVVKDTQPEYCIHGYTNCVRCGHLCWLGDETHKVVSTGRAYPLCLDCGNDLVSKDQRVVAHIADHRRADGPHDG